MFKKEKDALAKRKQNLQNKNDADWAKKMASSGNYGFNKSSNDTASVPATPSVNQRKIDADKQAHMAASRQKAQVNPNTSVASGTGKPPTVKPAAQENPNKSVASGTGKSDPLLYKNPNWRKQLGLNQDDEMVATVDDTASAPSTPQRKLPASVYDGEGPESVTSSGRDAREGRTKAEIQQMAADAGMPDPYANRKMPAQMSQAQIDARNASDSKFARNPDGSRKQQSMAQALINPPSSNNDELISQTDDSAGAAVSPSSGPYTYDPDEFLQNNPQPADASTVTNSQIRNADDAGDMSGVRKLKIAQDPSFGRGERDKEAVKGTGNQFDNMTAIGGSTPGGEEGTTAGGTDTNTTDAKLQKDLQQIAKPVRPEPGTGAKAFAKQLGYSSFAEFLRANRKNVNKAANGNWVVHPNKDYIPAK